MSPIRPSSLPSRGVRPTRPRPPAPPAPSPFSLHQPLAPSVPGASAPWNSQTHTATHGHQGAELKRLSWGNPGPSLGGAETKETLAGVGGIEKWVGGGVQGAPAHLLTVTAHLAHGRSRQM